MELRFDGRVAIITGGGRGIGRAYALQLAARGCRVVIADAGLNISGHEAAGDPASEVAAEIAGSGGHAVALRGNVLTDAKKIVECALDSFGRLDILINNAGPVGTFDLFAEAKPEAWHNVVNIHYNGTVSLCREAWPHLAASQAGRIINTASSAMFGNERQTDYGSAKAAIFGLTRSLALEGKSLGITANSILPSGFTRMMETIPDPEFRAKTKELMGPEHIATFVTWLVHHETTISGEAFNVGGGRAARIVIASGPAIKFPQNTPEIWRDQSKFLFDEDSFSRVTTMSENFAIEIGDIDQAAQHLADRNREVNLTKSE